MKNDLPSDDQVAGPDNDEALSSDTQAAPKVESSTAATFVTVVGPSPLANTTDQFFDVPIRSPDSTIDAYERFMVKSESVRECVSMLALKLASYTAYGSRGLKLLPTTSRYVTPTRPQINTRQTASIMLIDTVLYRPL